MAGCEREGAWAYCRSMARMEDVSLPIRKEITIMSDKDAFVAKMMARFPQLDDCESKSCFETLIGEWFDRGWSSTDMVIYLKTFEEITPAVDYPGITAEEMLADEARVFTKRAVLEMKYMKPEDIVFHDVRFEALGNMLR